MKYDTFWIICQCLAEPEGTKKSSVALLQAENIMRAGEALVMAMGFMAVAVLVAVQGRNPPQVVKNTASQKNKQGKKPTDGYQYNTSTSDEGIIRLDLEVQSRGSGSSRSREIDCFPGRCPPKCI